MIKIDTERLMEAENELGAVQGAVEESEKQLYELLKLLKENMTDTDLAETELTALWSSLKETARECSESRAELERIREVYETVERENIKVIENLPERDLWEAADEPRLAGVPVTGLDKTLGEADCREGNIVYGNSITHEAWLINALNL